MLSLDVSGRKKNRKTKAGQASQRSSNILQCQSFVCRVYPAIIGPNAGAIVVSPLQSARTYGNLFNATISVNEAGAVDKGGDPKKEQRNRVTMKAGRLFVRVVGMTRRVNMNEVAMYSPMRPKAGISLNGENTRGPKP
jgi:hypothetical protein